MRGDIKQYEIVYLINGNDIYLQKKHEEMFSLLLKKSNISNNGIKFCEPKIKDKGKRFIFKRPITRPINT